MLGHHLRRWPNIDPTLGERLGSLTVSVLSEHMLIDRVHWVLNN